VEHLASCRCSISIPWDDNHERRSRLSPIWCWVEIHARAGSFRFIPLQDPHHQSSALSWSSGWLSVSIFFLASLAGPRIAWINWSDTGCGGGNWRSDSSRKRYSGPELHWPDQLGFRVATDQPATQSRALTLTLVGLQLSCLYLSFSVWRSWYHSLTRHHPGRELLQVPRSYSLAPPGLAAHLHRYLTAPIPPRLFALYLALWLSCPSPACIEIGVCSP
jgi:hypothetical protein